MDRREFLTHQAALAALLAAGLLGCESRSVAEAPVRRPNVVFIITDDQRWDNLSCAGHPYLRTPNMDRIASEGVRFTNAFVVNSLCSPSRASFLSGLYTHQHGIYFNNNVRRDWFFENIPIFPRILHDAGYRTAYFGKLHMGSNNTPVPGFDDWMVLPGQGSYNNPRFNVNGENVRSEGWVDDITGDAVAEWIGQVEGPFCLVYGTKSPHASQIPPPRYEHLYDDVEIPEPDNSHEDYKQTGKSRAVAESGLTRKALLDDVKLKGGDWQRYIKDFYRCVTAADDEVGKVLDALDKRGIADDTLVIHVGDNGFMQGEHGILNKRLAYEESLRIPMLVRYPRRIPAGRTPGEMALNIDVFPTILEYCGVKAPEPVAGRSLVPILEGKKVDWRKEFFYECDEPTFLLSRTGKPMPHVVAVRTERYKTIVYDTVPSDTNELYDLEKDPREMRNVWSNPAYAEIRTKMSQLVFDTMKQVEYTPQMLVPQWELCGPYAGEQGKMLDTVFQPEQDPSSVEWKWTDAGADGFVDLVAALGGGEDSVRYARVSMRVDDPRCRPVLMLGHRRGVKVFLNGEVVGRRSTEVPVCPKATLFELPVRKGVNQLLVKIARFDGACVLRGDVQFLSGPGRPMQTLPLIVPPRK